MTNSRLDRLYAALEKRGADALVAVTRPNQLYLLAERQHPDPSTVISRGNCASVLFTRDQTVVFPGMWISNACRDLLRECEVVPNQPGDPPRSPAGGAPQGDWAAEGDLRPAVRGHGATAGP